MSEAIEDHVYKDVITGNKVLVINVSYAIVTYLDYSCGKVFKTSQVGFEEFYELAGGHTPDNR